MFLKLLGKRIVLQILTKGFISFWKHSLPGEPINGSCCRGDNIYLHLVTTPTQVLSVFLVLLKQHNDKLFSGMLTVLIDKCLPVTYSRYEPCRYLLNITQF